MNKKSSVYTKTGDKGTTGLVGGSRVSKGDQRIKIYGEVDELNSHIGVVISLINESSFKELLDEVKNLKAIQYYLFVIGSIFACEKENREKFSIPKITQLEISNLENNLDRIDSSIDPLKFFVLPGGHIVASHLHVCRTVCRRVEREAVQYESTHAGELPEDALKYLNRLSDFLFVLSRYTNKVTGKDETHWIPGEPIS